MSARLKTRFIPVWKEAPFIRLLPPLAAGIILQWYLQFPLPFIILCTLICIAVSGILLFTNLRTSFRVGVSVYSLLMLSGCWLVFVNHPETVIAKNKDKFNTKIAFIATIDEPPVATPKSFKASATIQIADNAGRIIPLKGKIIIYFSRDSIAGKLKYGDVIVFSKTPVEIKNSGNPGVFDYRRYAGFHGIYFQLFLSGNQFKKINGNEGSDFYKLLYSARNFVITQFKKYIPGKQEAGLAEALLVGYKEDLDKELVEQYASTGVVHIIAISGMHLGLIYGLLIVFFKPLQKSTSGRWTSNACIIIVLWLFSFLTGAAPSITRSALMFTAVLIGNSFSRKMSIYNSLAIAAFALLLVNPFNLWDVGFQLSFAALLSIAILSKPITSLFNSSNILLQNTWQLIAVTMAAQAFTLPLVVYHFHQFPLSFILSNLVAVPLSSVVLYALILLLFVSWVPLPAVAIGWLCFYAIKAMNLFIAWVASLSFARLENIYMDITGAILLYGMIALFATAFLKRSGNSLIAALIFSFLFYLNYAARRISASGRNELIVYNVPGKTAIDIILGNQYYFYGDSLLQQKSFLQNFHLLPSRIQHQVNCSGFIKNSSNRFKQIKCGSNQILLLDKSPVLNNNSRVLTDILIISASCRQSPGKILKILTCKLVVLDGTISGRRISEWKNAADSLHLRLHSVQQQGAFITEL